MEHKVDTTKEYTIRDIIKSGLLPWRNYRTIGEMVRRDQKEENILNVRIEGENKNTRYYIKGSNLLKFIKKYKAVFIYRK